MYNVQTFTHMRSNWQSNVEVTRSRSLGQKCENCFGACVCGQCMESHKTKTTMTDHCSALTDVQRQFLVEFKFGYALRNKMFSMLGLQKRTKWNQTKQEAQLSQRDRATLRVIEYFAKSPKVTQGHSQ